MINQISLAPFDQKDLPWILALEADAREEGYLRGNNIVAHQQRLAGSQTCYLSIFQSGEKVGFVILESICTEDRNVELARIIISQREKGIGQAAMREIIRYIFEELGAHRIWLDTLSHNVRAQHVYRKLGFKQEGRLREASYINGHYHDMILFGLLAEEWHQTILQNGK